MVIIALLAAIGDRPYDYYKLLRWGVCAVALFTAYQSYSWKRIGWTWLFGFVAILFNPIFPINLKRETWYILDLVNAIIFAFGAFYISEPSSANAKAFDE
jgi:hypothetical protein